MQATGRAFMVRDGAYLIAPFADGLACARPARVCAAPHHEGYLAFRPLVENAFLRILCRQPTLEEMNRCLEFLHDQTAALSDTKMLTAFSSGPAATVPPSSDSAQRAYENLVLVLFNHNDFITVR